MSSPVTSLEQFQRDRFQRDPERGRRSRRTCRCRISRRDKPTCRRRVRLRRPRHQARRSRAAAATLSTTSGDQCTSATVSDTTAITVGPTSTAVAGNYNVVVTSLRAGAGHRLELDDGGRRHHGGRHGRHAHHRRGDRHRQLVVDAAGTGNPNQRDHRHDGHGISDRPGPERSS